MSIASRIESIEEHIGNAYDSIEALGVDITDIDKNIENISSSIDGIYDTLPKVTDEGESITLDGTIKGRLKTTLKGNTSQNGTPTPDTPIPVNVVSGDNEVNIVSNMFDLTNGILNNTTKGIYTYDESDNSFILGTNATGNYVLTRFLCGKINNDNINVSFDFTSIEGSGISNYFIRITNTPNYDDNAGWPQTDYESRNKSFNVSNYKGKYLWIVVRNNTNSSVLYSAKFSNFMVNSGTTALPYTPHKEATYPINLPEGMELCNMPNTDYEDTFIHDKTLDKWYLHKEVGKVILNGRESWSLNGSPGGFKAYTTTLNDVKVIGNTNNEFLVICSCLVGNTASYVLNHFIENLSAIISNKRFYCMLNSTNFPDSASIKTYFTNNNATLYYVLETPTNTEITYQPLIEQLNNIEKAMSCNGQTNISQVNNDLPFIISASALKEWQESTSLNSTLSMVNPLSLGNTLNTQEIKNNTQPIEVDNIEPLEEGEYE